MSVALEDINRSNVLSLKRVKYTSKGKEYESDAILCESFEQFYAEYCDQKTIRELHRKSFFILNFEFTQSNFDKLIEDEGYLRCAKLVFLQNEIEIIIQKKFSARFAYCCSLAEVFNIKGELGFIDFNSLPSSCVHIHGSHFTVARFDYLSNFSISNSTVGLLRLGVSTLSFFKFNSNNIDLFEFNNLFNEIDKVPIELVSSTFNKIDFYSHKKIEKIAITSCDLRDSVLIKIEEEIGRLLFDSCGSASKAIFDLENVFVCDRFIFSLDRLPAKLVLPEMTTSAEKILELPQSVKIKPAHFIPFELSKTELEKRKRKKNVGTNVVSNDDFCKQIQSDRTRKNLERAYLIVKFADRKREAFDILEKILIEKRKRLLLERKIEIAGSTQNEYKKNLQQIFKYVGLRHIGSLLCGWGAGYFVNLKRLLFNFVGVVIFFSAIFYCGETLSNITPKLGESFFSLERGRDSLYFTIVTLTTLGYGDILPQSWGKLLVALLACIGLFLTGTILGVFLRRYSS